jgi:activator of 2-hydroxyglutaryl-CoA dehydratase/predicted nucleotide-binding protein (sugar kinase/HSP70/actin superfamily)
MATDLLIGIDIGSTTVKATVVDPETLAILWSDYRRHHTRQPEVVAEFLVEIGQAFPDVHSDGVRLFVTGSGAGPLAEPLGGKFVQEVNSVTMAVEKLHPDVGSVVELGGQDAKIIIFKAAVSKDGEETGDKQSTTSMNDKCASGTGATIDKCFIKVGMPPEETAKLHFDENRLHHVAAKCGVFAETDIVNLVKSGIPAPEIMCSLADAIVMQNLSVLTRGNTLRHRVLLLGGPNTYLPFLQECWRLRIPQGWEERGYDYPKDVPLEELIFVPENAEYYAAYGAVLFGLHEPADVGRYRGLEPLKEFISHGRKAKLGEEAGPPLTQNPEQLEEFREQFRIPRFEPATFQPGQVVRGAIGLDGGSTSSKCVLVDHDSGEILLKVYQLSKGNPIRDMKEMFARLRDELTSQGATLEVTGFGVTGYAGDVMEEALKADANIVETVAHMMSAVHYFGDDVDVICDIGGQDIKVLFLHRGDIKNFRLSNQCSAGNGMLLQAMADQFGIPIQEYAETAFGAGLSPKFSYGCAVFLDTDRVNFQKEGYSKEELLAGLALVLPKNVWQYVVQIPRMAELGRKFVLQGGTQHNLAALKAQVDYISERVPGADVRVHPHTGEAGAIGAAMEAIRVVNRRAGASTFVGLDAAIDITYTSTNDESTRCHFCPNECSRTFIDTATPAGATARYISGFSCEKGTVEDVDALKVLNAKRKARLKRYPNLVDYEANACFKRGYFKTADLPPAGQPVEDLEVKRTWLGGVKRVPIRRSFRRSPAEATARRSEIRIGIPRVLNIYSTGPMWRAYFETLGILPQNVVFSDFTSEELWAAGGKYGSVDPCYPGKVAQAHIHNLLFDHHERKPLHYLFFPSITHVPSFVVGTMDNTSCPVVAGTPSVMKAAFTKETDFFATRGIEYLATAVTLEEPTLLKRAMFETFGARLGVTEDESDFAMDEAWRALEHFNLDLQSRGREILEQMEAEERVAILLLGRPYHNDPGLNHGVLEEFQALGYPVLSIGSLPKDPAWLERFFRDDLEREFITSPLDVNDVWPENYSTNSVAKVWAAKLAARHPNLAVLDLSSFKCGHDAPTYGLIDSIISTANRPYSALHDIDANKPGGSIKIRVKTYAHSLKLHEERIEDVGRKKRELVWRLAEKRVALLEAALARRGSQPGLEAKLTAARAAAADAERTVAEDRARVADAVAAAEAEAQAQATSGQAAPSRSPARSASATSSEAQASPSGGARRLPVLQS